MVFYVWTRPSLGGEPRWIGPGDLVTLRPPATEVPALEPVLPLELRHPRLALREALREPELVHVGDSAAQALPATCLGGNSTLDLILRGCVAPCHLTVMGRCLVRPDPA